MKYEDLIDEWDKDSGVDKQHLDDETINTIKLHAKYLRYFSKEKMKLKVIQDEYNSLILNKWKWYHGRLSKQEMDNFGWVYDPFDGCNKPLKTDLELYYKADKDIQKFSRRVEYQKQIIETLKEILDSLRWRHNAIKNMIEFRKFQDGN